VSGVLSATPGQTIGPFFGYALPYDGGEHLVPLSHPDAIRLTGRVLDGHGDPVPDALLEIWQPDSSGRVARQAGSLRRDGYTFTGWGRAATDTTGWYSFTTVLPGPTGHARPPFIAMTVFARGLLNRLFTRVYLPGSGDGWAADPLLASLTEDRRRTLIARRDSRELQFDIRLQGEAETVFLRYQ
jgi:protocatechuate 3,4-dioxygenase alpha subunit